MTSVVDEVGGASFARVFSQRSGQLAWLLGAGASASANVPTGWDMIVDFKTRLYCAQTGIPRGEVDATDPLWLERINHQFDGAHGMPPLDDPAEYASAFEAVFPDARDRRTYIDEAVRKGTPSYAHRVLASLISAGKIPCLITTNFDSLIEDAAVITDDLLPAPERAHLTVASLDAADRATRCVRESSWPLLIKLHGDYQSVQLKNTPAELQEQDQRLRAAVVELLHRFGLVVAGYSGRDDSVMDALEEALDGDDPMPGGVWWVTRPGQSVLPRVTALLDRAGAAGVEVHTVVSENIDELAGDLDREMQLGDPLRTYVDGLRPRPLVEPVALPSVPAGGFPVLRCSALEVLAWPAEARAATLKTPFTYSEVRQRIRDADVWLTASVRGRELVAFGADDSITAAFADAGVQVGAVRSLSPIDDLMDRGLLYEAFVRAITRRRPLRARFWSRGHEVSVRPPDADRDDFVAVRQREDLAELRAAYGDPLTGTVPGIGLSYAEAIRVRLECWNDRWFCVFEPFTYVDLPSRPRPEDDNSPSQDSDAHAQLVAAASDWRRERWARRYNATSNSILAAWAKLLAPEQETELTTHHFDGAGVNARFRLSWMTAWSRPGRRLGDSP